MAHGWWSIKSPGQGLQSVKRLPFRYTIFFYFIPTPGVSNIQRSKLNYAILCYGKHLKILRYLFIAINDYSL